MDFIQFFQYLGYHVPALGAFLCSLIVMLAVCFICFRMGKRSANKAWTYDVEHRENIISQDIRERFERKLAVLEDRDKLRQSRMDGTLTALFRLLTDLTEYFKENR